MDGSRTYSVQFNNVSISAVQDLFLLQATASMSIRLLMFEISADATTTIAQIRLSIKRLPATVTAGSVGTAVTPQLVLDTDQAATFTARCNDTTRATTSGTSATLWSSSINVLNGYQWLPIPQGQFSCKPSAALVVGMEVAPGSATVFDGVCLVQECF